MPKEKTVIKPELIQENGSVKHDKFLCLLLRLVTFFFNNLDHVQTTMSFELC